MEKEESPKKRKTNTKKHKRRSAGEFFDQIILLNVVFILSNFSIQRIKRRITIIPFLVNSIVVVFFFLALRHKDTKISVKTSKRHQNKHWNDEEHLFWMPENIRLVNGRRI